MLQGIGTQNNAYPSPNVATQAAYAKDQAGIQTPQTRSIEQLTCAIQELCSRQSDIRSRIVGLASRLGYNQPESNKTAPSPVPNGCLENLADYMRQLAQHQDDMTNYMSQIERHI